MMRSLLCSSLVALAVAGSSRCLGGDEKTFRWTASFLPALRNGYIFPGSNTEKVSNTTLLAGKSFPGAGLSRSLRPWGVEVDGVYLLSTFGGPFATARAVPFGLRVPGSAEQTGIDWFLSAGYEASAQLGATGRMGMRLGVRGRRWEISRGAFPDSGHAGLTLLAFYERSGWLAQVEAALMAFNFGNDRSLGRQRDASTLRLRGGYRVVLDDYDVVPMLEFFHTHRNFYGSTVIAGEPALFVDEVSLALSLAVEW